MGCITGPPPFSDKKGPARRPWMSPGPLRTFHATERRRYGTKWPNSASATLTLLLPRAEPPNSGPRP